ncbi:MAG: hypothetical protein C5B48_05895 [Candidatus Rokuibacteriota bacterium]|nr:MAG: hypothetical protein C5B48_05895 [Candidatus Rokubacteria bacterium]
MGTGAYLSSQAENQLFRSEIRQEEAEVEDDPEVEQLELELLLEEEGLESADARAAAERIARSRTAFVKTKVEKELGIPYGGAETEVGDALVVGTSYAVAALVPLWPYFLLPVSTALPLSLVSTGLALFALGLLKGKVARMVLVRGGLWVLLIGGVSAGIGYLIGSVGPRLFSG